MAFTTDGDDDIDGCEDDTPRPKKTKKKKKKDKKRKSKREKRASVSSSSSSRPDDDSKEAPVTASSSEFTSSSLSKPLKTSDPISKSDDDSSYTASMAPFVDDKEDAGSDGIPPAKKIKK